MVINLDNQNERGRILFRLAILGQKNREGRLGWGNPEILKATGITEARYTMYMVCISIILAVGRVDSIFTCPYQVRCTIDA